MQAHEPSERRSEPGGVGTSQTGNQSVLVIPAKAGTQATSVPAFAGMTREAAATAAAPNPAAQYGTEPEYGIDVSVRFSSVARLWRRRRGTAQARRRWLGTADHLRSDAAPAHGLGHNGGPLLGTDPDDPHASWRLWCWKRAAKRAWKTPPREIALRRLARAEAAGMTYRQYTLEILERGIFPAVPRRG